MTRLPPNDCMQRTRRLCFVSMSNSYGRRVADAARWRHNVRNHLILGLVILAVALCNSCGRQSRSSDDSPKIQWVDPANLKPGPIRHEALSDDQRQRIAAVQKVFAEVDSSPIEKWFEDFRRDVNPGRELSIWEAMAAAYSRYNSDKSLSLEQRKELFGVLLTGSGAPEEEAIKHLKLKVLSEAEARSALRTLAAEWAKKRQSDGAANRSQPGQPQTNRTSAAAGSRR